MTTVAVGLIAGCTAIIDGAQQLPSTDPAPSFGSQSAVGDALTGAAGNDTPATSADGGSGELELGSAGAANVGATGGAAAAGGAAQPGDGDGGVAAELGGASAGGSSDASAGEASGGAGSADQNVGGTGATAGSNNAGGGAGGPSALQPGDPAKGHKLVILDNCYRCHGDNLAGRSFYRNITPEIETGIGAWTDKQIATAVLGAVGPNGEIFCATMPLYSGFKAQEVADLIAYLRLVPAVKNQIVPVCPGHDP